MNHYCNESRHNLTWWLIIDDSLQMTHYCNESRQKHHATKQVRVLWRGALHLCGMSRSKVWHDSFINTLFCGAICTTGWRRLIGCLKVQVIFRKRATNYTALLQKMTYEDKASYDSTPPCTWYGVAWISRLLKIIGLFCKKALQKRRYSAKETYTFKEPTNRSHPICLVHKCDLTRS